jgi:6-pyruvoyltetrahydropterin/6-carboxytetrahydropterin synthase
MNVTVHRKEHFNATHRLHNPNWDDETNERIFGKCNNPEFHGHNYDLIVSVTGEVDRESGYVVDMKILKELIRKYVIERYDHKNLYTDVEDFSDLNPTAENIAIVIWNLLREKIDKDHQLKIKLYETERNFVEYSGN